MRLYLNHLQNADETHAIELCFDESKCKSTDEIDQDTPASQFKETGLKKNVSVESKFASKIKRRK